MPGRVLWLAAEGILPGRTVTLHSCPSCDESPAFKPSNPVFDRRTEQEKP